MTDVSQTLSSALKDSNMLEIDGLFCFEFSFDNDLLQVECMDGRDTRRWRFNAQQVAQARFDAVLNRWNISSDSGEHLLVCMSAFSPSDDGDEGDNESEGV